MQVILAGFNIDREVIEDLTKGLHVIRESARRGLESPTKSHLRQIIETVDFLLSRQDFTPETISAAYARISRDPRPVNELRRESRQEIKRARRSNRSIVYTMGHSSIAEHAVFNFDVLGVSRLILEQVQAHRLLSFTEKSQRYIKLDSDFIIPRELDGMQLRDEFLSAVLVQYQTYERLFPELTGYFKQLEVAEDDDPYQQEAQSQAMNRAKEDARYVLGLCVTSQMGMTVNARTLEMIIRRLRALPLQEAQELAAKLYEESHAVAPSLIR
ncbi:FAD-dependent thymidylate synthase, partial [bacterium]|nr:FAD-dependent thymidylate synthase [candidate division CSSED10-310 bacterium]